ncbi:MAG: efflux transporter outer membrane subunit [Acidobacteria bacterium]|nr:MAG: efflux transporter outer membrane subunit [Acidobacteriota bacterium]
MRRLSAIVVLALSACLAGCLLGPNYHRPAISAPAAYRGAAAATATPQAAASLGNEKWFTLFQDPVLQRLLRTAVANNYDVRIAAARVLAAQQQAGITRAGEFPFAAVDAGVTALRNPKTSKALPSYSTRFGRLNLDVLWNLDFWGKYRRATEAARDQWFATRWGQRAVVSSVVAQVAVAYFQLRELDAALAIAQKTIAARQDSLHLIQVLDHYGSASDLDVAQAQELESQAGETIPDLQRQIAQQENLLRTLMGENPGPIPRGAPLTAQPNPPSVPAGLPSALLDRRPDIRAAEMQLAAANAQIGVAKAALFPSITLTASGGVESYALNRLFSPAGRQWNVAGDLLQPVFAAGSLRAGVRLSEAQKQAMLLTYEQSIQNAFAQVSDALVGLQKDHQFRQQQQTLTQAAEKAEQLSQVLYQHGGGSFLQVLVAETNSFSAQLNLSQAELNERLALVALYNALGGGWQR